MSIEDRKQEYELIKIEHLLFTKYQLDRRVMSVQNSRHWADSDNHKFPHLSLDVFEESDPDLPIINILANRFLSYEPFENFEAYIDLYIAINNLSNKYRKVINFVLKGYNHEEIGKKLRIERSTVSKRYKKAIEELREMLCPLKS
jgi:RNA polymerase sigma factor (sigma-70 family)